MLGTVGVTNSGYCVSALREYVLHGSPHCGSACHGPWVSVSPVAMDLSVIDLPALDLLS